MFDVGRSMFDVQSVTVPARYSFIRGVSVQMTEDGGQKTIGIGQGA
jgi:hypothetical protein